MVSGEGESGVYDAWDHLVSLSGATTVTYSYDGMGRLDVTDVSRGATTFSYYAGQNPIETRVGGTAATNIQYQYVWSPLAVKSPLMRDTYSGGAIVPDDRLYYLTDANSNVTAVVGLSGGVWQVTERYVYDPYGKR